MPQPTLRGSALVLLLYDVSEEIRLAELGAKAVLPSFKQHAPAYVRFERPPVVELLPALVLEGGDRLEAQIKYYDYGVVCVVFEVPFAGDWDDLVAMSARWIGGTEFERHALRIAKEKLSRAGKALVKPYENWLQEDYFIFHITDIAGDPSASEILASQGDAIACVVRGETLLLAEGERKEVLQSRLSYYPNDLTVIGWNAAFVYDTPSGADTAIQLLEYANSQLLEFRHYDDLLTTELSVVYRSLDEGTGILSRWRLARDASRLHTVLLDVMELTERADNAIKFLSDMFSARLYRLAAQKTGVLDYKDLVNQKIRTAQELYRFMVDQFHQGRAFVLELMVVIILVIELVYLFKGQR
jgi:hypothetical protein